MAQRQSRTPGWKPLKKEECSGIMIFAECFGGRVSEESLQLLTPAKKISEKLGCLTTVALLGHRISHLTREPSFFGADRVILVDEPKLAAYYPNVYGSALVELARGEKPELLLIAGTLRGRELAPYVANALGTGLTADCTGFDVDEATKDVLQIRPPFGATMLAYIRTPKQRPQMATVRPNVFPLPTRNESMKGEGVTRIRVEVPEPAIRLVNSEAVEKDQVAIEKSEVVVSGGKGIGSKDGFELVERLASAIKGVVAGSRKAVDAGWVGHERQVGQTGKTIKPTLYVALGISGSAQHIFGIREAKVVAAVNIDPDAPIFESADYGITGDYRAVAQAMIDRMSGS